MARIMGILNVTPDSFSDGGLYLDAERAMQRAMLELGGKGDPAESMRRAEGALRKAIPHFGRP